MSHARAIVAAIVREAGASGIDPRRSLIAAMIRHEAAALNDEISAQDHHAAVLDEIARAMQDAGAQPCGPCRTLAVRGNPNDSMKGTRDV